MRYSQLKTVITAQFSSTNRVSYLMLGKPGGGKSALCRDIVHSLGGTEDNTVEFNASTRDPVDVLGTPTTRGTARTGSHPRSSGNCAGDKASAF